MEGKFISYLRVSTKKQGLGLEAQRQAVDNYLNGGNHELIGEYKERETGKRTDRPELIKALKHAKLTGATVIVAKLDRLSRNARFLLGLLEQKVPVVFCDLPQIPPGPVGEFIIGQMAQVAQLEAGLISERTKNALAEVNRHIEKTGSHTSKGGRVIKRLGNPHGAAHLDKQAAARLAGKASERRADERAASLRELVAECQAAGATTTRAIANALNERGIYSPQGGAWHPSSVLNLLRRLEPTGGR
jgi:DNA invertase Pin-like site-specific DNA recombinase